MAMKIVAREIRCLVLTFTDLPSHVSISDMHFVAAGSSQLSAVFLIINAALGAGLLNFPQAFDQAGGIVTAIIVQVVISCN
jgi:hypothetical protein